MKKTLTVIETVTHRFEIDTETPPFDLEAFIAGEIDVAEDWFIDLDDPYMEADYAEVSDRTFELADSERQPKS